MIISWSNRYLKYIIVMIAVLCSVVYGHSQNTATLTGTVTDSTSQVWAYATWIANINVPGGGSPMWISGGPAPRSYSGVLNSSGTFPSGAVIGRNSQIVPAGTTWTFTVYSLTSAPPSTVGPISITGTTYAAGAYLSSGVSPPVVPSSNLSYAYNTAEIADPVNGNGTVLTTTNLSYLYNNGWVQFGGGGSGCTGDSVTGNVSFSGQIGTFQSGCLASVGSPFAVTISCSAAGAVETGDTSTNPNDCTFGYSNGTAASGTLGDGTHTVTLTTPYTSGALDYAYSTNTTFTVNATATNSQTASATDSRTFTSRTFGGVGTAGATGATASGTSAVLVGATGTLASAGLGNQTSYGPYSPSNQNIYILNLSGSCTFTSGGFNFPMNTPTTITFVNQYGASITMYLYQSTNLLSAPFTINPTC